MPDLINFAQIRAQLDSSNFEQGSAGDSGACVYENRELSPEGIIFV